MFVLQFADIFLPIPFGGTVYLASSNPIEVSAHILYGLVHMQCIFV